MCPSRRRRPHRTTLATSAHRSLRPQRLVGGVHTPLRPSTQQAYSNRRSTPHDRPSNLEPHVLASASSPRTSHSRRSVAYRRLTVEARGLDHLARQFADAQRGGRVHYAQFVEGVIDSLVAPPRVAWQATLEKRRPQHRPPPTASPRHPSHASWPGKPGGGLNPRTQRLDRGS